VGRDADQMEPHGSQLDATLLPFKRAIFKAVSLVFVRANGGGFV
jgi:hypothetical protein